MIKRGTFQVLTDEEKQMEESEHSRSKRAAVRDRSRIWPDNTVPYLIDDDFSGMCGCGRISLFIWSYLLNTLFNIIYLL